MSFSVVVGVRPVYQCGVYTGEDISGPCHYEMFFSVVEHLPALLIAECEREISEALEDLNFNRITMKALGGKAFDTLDVRNFFCTFIVVFRKPCHHGVFLFVRVPLADVDHGSSSRSRP